MIDYVTVSDTPPYSQPEPYICLSLTNLHLLKMHKPIYKQAFTGNDIPTPKFFQIFTYGSEVDEKDAAAVVSSVAPSSSFSCRLRDHCSIYRAELQGILFALK